jgi:phage pi2 protein 07
MKKIQAIMNKMEGKEETSDTVTKSETTIDQLVLAMAQAIDKISEKMNASGVTIPGFQKHIVDQIKSDPDIQAVIKEMMATPGFKKSVSMGVPYMTTKEGNRFALTASEMSETTIRKSQSAEKKSFKQVYKEDLASIKE